MKSVKIKVNGKINLGLNITGFENSYHNLQTIMAEINLADTVIVRTRKDNLINLSTKGCAMNEVATVDNNVYKTAKAFMEKFHTHGADIILEKKIPVGSGLGGSSADIVATAKAMAKAYDICDDLLPFVSSLCSDGEFLLNGGCWLVSGRSKCTKQVLLDMPVYILLVVPEGESNTRAVFEEYDRINYTEGVANFDEIIELLNDRANTEGTYQIYNALYQSATNLNNQIEIAYNKLLALSPKAISMSGSGCSVYAIFSSLELCLWAKEIISKDFDNCYVKELVV